MLSGRLEFRVFGIAGPVSDENPWISMDLRTDIAGYNSNNAGRDTKLTPTFAIDGLDACRIRARPDRKVDGKREGVKNKGDVGGDWGENRKPMKGWDGMGSCVQSFLLWNRDSES